MKIKSFTPLLALAGFSLSFTSANAASLIYEPFSQTAGGLGGQAGGTGLSGNWTTNQVVNVVNPPTLDYGDLENTGGQVTMSVGSGTWAAISTTTALADAGLLNDGATLWFSYVFQKSASGGTNEQSGFAFGTDRINPAFNGVNMQNSGFGFGVYTNSASVVASSWSAGTRTAGGTVALQNTDPVIANGGTLATLVIGRIVWGATSSDNDVLTLWTRALDDIATEPTTGGAVRSTAGFDQTQLNTISFGLRNSGTGSTQTYDEIRFGASFADVSPIPEPTTALLGGLGLLALLRRRR